MVVVLVLVISVLLELAWYVSWYDSALGPGSESWYVPRCGECVT